MANVFAKQILLDGKKNVAIKLTGVLDTSDLAVQTAVDLSTLSPVPTTVYIEHIDYAIGDQLEIDLQWHATTNVDILPIAGRGRMSYWSFGGLQNNAGAGKNGNIDLYTKGWASGVQMFTIVLELVKQGV